MVGSGGLKRGKRVPCVGQQVRGGREHWGGFSARAVRSWGCRCTGGGRGALGQSRLGAAEGAKVALACSEACWGAGVGVTG